MFVREGDVIPRVLTASESAARARQKEGDSALARRSAAAEVAKRLAQKANEMRMNRKRSSSPYAEDGRDIGSRTGGGRSRSRERRRDEPSGERRLHRSRSRSRSRDRYCERDRRISGRPDRGQAEPHQGVDRGRRLMSDQDTSERFGSSKHASDKPRKAPAAAKADIDYRRLVPGWDRMTPADQLKARVRLSLQRAGNSSLVRDREEREVAICEAEQGGRMAEEELEGASRPWTRFVFDRSAPLDEEGARPSLAFLDDRRGEAGGFDNVDGAFRGAPSDEKGGGEGMVNALSFRTSGQVAAQRQRDGDHEAAIFGARADPIKAARGGTKERVLDAPKGSSSAADPGTSSGPRVKASSVVQLLARMGDDAPMVVTEEEILEAQARALGKDTAPSGPPLKSGPGAESDEIKERQKAMTWRERALLARAGKST